MRPVSVTVIVAVLCGLGPVSRALAQSVLAETLVFNAIQPCRIVDTRSASAGRLLAGQVRTFDVVGSGSGFPDQGGLAGGCGIPGFQGAAPQVQAVMFNFVAVNPSGAGNLRAWPSDHAVPNAAVLNYAAVAGGLNIANGIAIPVRQDVEGDDLSVRADVSATDLVVDVVGYFSVNAAVVYTRWGRTTCPAGVELIYEGVAAGSHYAHSGGGKNTLCLSRTPGWLSFSDGNQDGSLMYGLQYQTAGYGVASLVALQGFEAPCAACLRRGKAVVIMAPGQPTCPAGWTLEYAGYLMATQYTQIGSTAVCVDQDAEGVGSPSAAPGDLWYPTEAECGSLPCPPYVQNRELTCSVCSR